MIERYSRPEMAAIWSEDRKLALWQEIEALVLEGWAELGVVPPEPPESARVATVSVADWRTREAETRHDVAAFVDVLSSAMDDHGRWVHYGLTSSDVLDTALGVQLTEAGSLIAEGLVELLTIVQRLADEHRATVMVGRTHGMWAEPTTFGHKLAGFGFQLVNAHHRVLHATHTAGYGKISGPVGNRSTVPEEVERHVVANLGIRAEPAATQIVSRDRHATFVNTLAVVASTLERFAVEIRHLQRSEVAEVAEPFSEGQKGSSAMPHKLNPILSENITGLARLVRGFAGAAMENVALWHERDISHSSVERIVLPDACLAVDFAVARMGRVIEGLTVDRARMAANLEASAGAVFSQAVLLALIESGLERDAAYRMVQSAASHAMDEGIHLRTALERDEEIPLDAHQLDAAFNLDGYLQHAEGGVDHLLDVTPEWMRSRTVV